MSEGVGILVISALLLSDELTMDTPSVKGGGGEEGNALRRWFRSRRKKEPSV